MISSRRLAREWALKTLYQMDVGKVPAAEARASVLERLRMEFVTRGSRKASGSLAEQSCLDFITDLLSGRLEIVRPAVERALCRNVENVFSGAAYWQETVFEKSARYRFKPDKSILKRRFSPATEVPILPEDATPAETELITSFTAALFESLPMKLLLEMRRTVRTIMPPATTASMPLFGGSAALNETIEAAAERNREFALERWTAVGEVVSRHLAEWLVVGAFTWRLLNLMEQHRSAIDAKLEALAGGWRLERQVAVDRNILRLAALEILFVPEIPVSASINEAVELAKKYSTAESGGFVNGVLGALAAGVEGVKSADADEADLLIEEGPEDVDLYSDEVSDSEESVETDEEDDL